MKKTYFKPELKVVKLQSRTRLMVGSVTSVGGNVFNSKVNGGTGTARSRGDNSLYEDESDFDF